jgi:hypothetical protein
MDHLILVQLLLQLLLQQCCNVEGVAEMNLSQGPRLMKEALVLVVEGVDEGEVVEAVATPMPYHDLGSAM